MYDCHNSTHTFQEQGEKSRACQEDAPSQQRSAEGQSILVKPDRDVVAVLNRSGNAQAHVIDEAPKLGDTAEEDFGAMGIGFLSHY